MPDSKAKRGKPDRIRVSLNQPHERVYWSRKFNCTVPRLREAVDKAGHMALDVASFLLGGEYEEAKDDDWQDDGVQGQGS